jgi:site-specific DNA-cytosine methylase
VSAAADEIGCTLEVDHKWSCENNKALQEFLAMRKVPVCFKDASKLNASSGCCCINRASGPQTVSTADLVIGGWLCVDFSSANMNRREFLDGIAEKKGLSGKSFDWMCNFLSTSKAVFIVGENVRLTIDYR